VAAYRARSRRQVVPEGAVLHLDMSVPIVEVPPSPLSALLSPQAPLSLRSIVTALEAAAKDSRVRGVICTFGADTAPPLAVVQELGKGILDFRMAQQDAPEGVRRFAWVSTDTFGEAGQGVGMQQYLLASHFDKVFMQPSGMVGLLGVHQPTFFYKKLLAKIGIQPQFFKFFEYKNAPNSLTEEGYTDAHRHQSQLLADSIFEQMTATIAHHRNRSLQQIRASIDLAPLNAQQALEHGLIDAVLYTDQVVSMVSEDKGREAKTPPATNAGDSRVLEAKPNIVSMRAYIKATQGGKEDSLLGSVAGSAQDKKPRIALIHACGNIVRGKGTKNSSEPQAASEKIGAAIRSAYLDDKVRALVVRVDSRGGSAVASDSIRRELDKARALGLPVVVSMGAYAASGGYYLATAADRIVAQPGTITGSIGAFFGKLNMQALFANLGIDVDEIFIGQDANFLNPARPLSESQARKAEALGRQVYDDFVGHVVASRKLSAEQVDAVARGRVWTGAQAHSLNLVDQLGGNIIYTMYNV
jgi:protease-4